MGADSGPSDSPPPETVPPCVSSGDPVIGPGAVEKDEMKGLVAVAGLALMALVVVMAPAQADFRRDSAGPGHDSPGDGGRRGQPAPARGYSPPPSRSADDDLWHRGAWWQGRHDGREGWWWIVGSRWSWYPSPVYPSPSPYSPPPVSPPLRGGTDRSGDHCRDYRQTVTVGGQPSTAYGTACRQADGSWKLISRN